MNKLPLKFFKQINTVKTTDKTKKKKEFRF